MVYKLLDTFLPLHAQFGIIFPFIIQKRCDLFVLPLLLSRKPPSGTRRFGNHLSLWLVILIQLKELRSFNNPPAHRPQTPACVWRPLRSRISMYADTFVYLRQERQRPTLSALASTTALQNQPDNSLFSPWREAFFPPTRLVFFL